MFVSAKDLTPRCYEQLWGGEGTVSSIRLLEGLPGSAIKVVALNRIPPGASIGLHRHENEEDCYFCVSGSGIVIDDGIQRPFVPGTLQITRHNETQAIRNTGDEDLVVFVFLIASPTQSLVPAESMALR